MTIVQVLEQIEQLRSKQTLTSWDKLKLKMMIKFVSCVKCTPPEQL